MIGVSSRRFTLAALAVALFGAPLSAQAPSGRISGVVRDARGAGREAATVTATGTGAGTTRSAITGPDGSYQISGLVPGSYTVSVALVGFRRVVRTDVQVTDETTVDFALEPFSLQAVTVTATLREQELADVPFSVAAPTGQTLRERGAETIEAVAANVAGFSVQNLGPGQSQVAIRGASAGQIARDQPGVKEQAGVYLDESPISLSLFTPDLDLFDVQRVEVLRGPQGTLFGSGSLSGTVRYITGQPELGIRSTFGEVGASQVSDGSAGSNVRLGSNVPFGDRTAARVVLYQNRFGGYMDAVQPNGRVDEDVNTGTRTGVRAAVRFEPTPQFSIVPRIVYQAVRMDGWNRIDAFNILANPYTTTRPAITLGERQQFTQIEEPFEDDFMLGDVSMRYDFGPVNVTSVTSYTTRDVLVTRDAGALTSSITGGTIGLPEAVYTLPSPLYDATTARVFTQEVRLAGGNEGLLGLRWLVGTFYSSNQRDYGQSLMVPGFTAATEIPTRGLRAENDELFYSDLSYDLRQAALFGEATVTLLPRLDLTGGLRYYNFDEKRDQVFDAIFANDNTGTALVSVPGETKADGFAPRVIASFRAAEGLTFNAQAARGFRLGGINDPLNVPLCTPEDLQTFSGRDSWTDETAWNYEVGTKAQFMDGRATLNVSAFHMDITDLQLIVTAGSCSSRLVFNVPKSISQGIELELGASPSEFFDFSVSGTYNRSELRSTLTSTDSLGVTSVVSGIESGKRLPSVPKVQGAVSATVRQPMAWGQGYLTATVNHVGSRYTQIDDHAEGFGVVDLTSFGDNTLGGPLQCPQSQPSCGLRFTFDPLLPAYTLGNVRLGLTRGNTEVALFVNNITDERAFLALDRERGTRARVGYLTNQPRTFGLTFGFSY